MSGIVGILQRDGAPVAQPLLRGLAQFLAYRGPDGRDVWADGAVGFGHTLLRTGRASVGERQPASLEARYWIVADARLDSHAELEAELDSAERRVPSDAGDAELILQAYAAWGEDCVQHLRGDFAFAIWDARRRTLFCARDHFGIKPFYYADLGGTFLFSNTLDCVRLHPEVSDELNDAAIADFLLFGLNCDVATTTFRDIQRLPAAHFLMVSPAGVRMERYWSAPTNGRIRYRRDEDYIEHFLLLMGAAVSDRIRADRVGIWLSGGMDSSTVAALAREIAEANGAPELRAYTVSVEKLMPDQEASLARQVAEFLRIPIRVTQRESPQLSDRFDHLESIPSEPIENPFFAGLYDDYARIAEDCRATLSGEGSDNLQYFQMWPYAQDLLRRGEWRRFLADGSHFLRVRPFPWKGLRHRVQRLAGRADEPTVPRWIAPDFAKRVDLEARWKKYSALPRPPRHPLKPKAHASLSLPQWSQSFELTDPGASHCPVETRYPFLDLRVVNYLLAIPPFPWAFHKRLLRQAMVNRLPENICRRPKTPLAKYSVVAMLERQKEAAAPGEIRWAEDVDRYVDRSAISTIENEKTLAGKNQAIRPLCLNLWLRHRRGLRYNLIAEALHG
ncbi:MAG TPA: asparagine synthase-related protein [Candidatus Baltobacteraceae bacterium]|nr:asparagine synthase-related protein [Candidatus Baltobacteraceae bacterium]